MDAPIELLPVDYACVIGGHHERCSIGSSGYTFQLRWVPWPEEDHFRARVRLVDARWHVQLLHGVPVEGFYASFDEARESVLAHGRAHSRAKRITHALNPPRAESPAETLSA